MFFSENILIISASFVIFYNSDSLILPNMYYNHWKYEKAKYTCVFANPTAINV